MTWRMVGTLFVAFGACVLVTCLVWFFALLDGARAEECEPCLTCAADPVFVQPDARRPEIVGVLKHLKARQLAAEGVDKMIVLLGGERGVYDGSGQPLYTIVLIGSRGSRQSLVVSSDVAARLGISVPIIKGAN